MAVELTAVAAVAAGSMTPTGRQWLKTAGERVAALRSLVRDAFVHPYHQLRVEEDTVAPLATYTACLVGEAEPKRCCTVLRGEVLLLGPAIDHLEPMLSLGGAEVSVEEAKVLIAGWQPPPKVELEFDSEEEARAWELGLKQAANSYRAPPGRLLGLVEHLVAQEMHNADLAALAFKTKGRCERLESKLKNTVAQDKDTEEALHAKLEKAEQTIKLLRRMAGGATDEEVAKNAKSGPPVELPPAMPPAMPVQGDILAGRLDALESQRLEIEKRTQSLLKDGALHHPEGDAAQQQLREGDAAEAFQGEEAEHVAVVHEKLRSLTRQLSELATRKGCLGSEAAHLPPLPEGPYIQDGVMALPIAASRRSPPQALITSPVTSPPRIAEGPPPQELLAAVEGQLREATQRISMLEQRNEQLTAQVWRYEHQVQADTGSAAHSSGDVEQAGLVAQMQGLVEQKAEQVAQLMEANRKLADEAERERQLHQQAMQDAHDRHNADIALLEQAAAAEVEQLQVTVHGGVQQAIEEERNAHYRELEALRELQQQALLDATAKASDAASLHEEERARFRDTCQNHQNQLEEAHRLRQEHVAELTNSLSQRDEELRQLRQDHGAELNKASQREEELLRAHKDHVATTLQEREEELWLAHQARTTELEAAVQQREEALRGHQGQIAELEAAARHRDEADITRVSRMADLERACAAQQERIQELEGTYREWDEQLQRLHNEVAERDQILAQLREHPSKSGPDTSEALGELAELRQLCTIQEERVRQLEEENREKEGNILRMQGEVVRKSQELEQMALAAASPRMGSSSPEHNDLRDIVNLTFEPGSLGMSFEAEAGMAVEVDEFGQANKNGVQPGWVMYLIDGVPYAAELFEQKMSGYLPYVLSFKTQASFPAVEKAILVRQVQQQRLDLEVLQQQINQGSEPVGMDGEIDGQVLVRRALHAEAQLEQLMSTSRDERDAMQEALARLENQHASAQQRAAQAEREMHAAAAREAAQRQERDASLKRLSEVEERLAQVEALYNKNKVEPSHQLDGSVGHLPTGLLSSSAGHYAFSSSAHLVAGSAQPLQGETIQRAVSTASSPSKTASQPISPTDGSIPVEVEAKVIEARVIRAKDLSQAQVLHAAVLSDGAASGASVSEALSPPAGMQLHSTETVPGGRVIGSQQLPLAWPPVSLLPRQANGLAEPAAGVATAAPSTVSGSDSASNLQVFSSSVQRPLSNSRITTLPTQVATTTGRLSPMHPPQTLWSQPESRPASIDLASQPTTIPLQSAAKACASSHALQQPQINLWSSVPCTASPRGPAIQPGLLASAPQRTLQTSIRWIQPGVAQRQHDRPAASMQTVVQAQSSFAARNDGPSNNIQLQPRGSWASVSGVPCSSEQMVQHVRPLQQDSQTFQGIQALSRSMPPRVSSNDGTAIR